MKNEKVFAWIEESGTRLVGPTREVYLNDHERSPQKSF
jgi:effector-binding domain-containing protein